MRKSVLAVAVAFLLIVLALLDANANASPPVLGTNAVVTETVTEVITQTTTTTVISNQYTTQTVTQTVTQAPVTQIVTQTTTIQVPSSSASSIPSVGGCSSNQPGRCNMYVSVAGDSSVMIMADGVLYACGGGACSNPTGQVTIGSTVTAWFNTKTVSGTWNVNGVSLSGTSISFSAPASDLRIAVTSQSLALALDLSSQYSIPLVFVWYDTVIFLAGIIALIGALVLNHKGD